MPGNFQKIQEKLNAILGIKNEVCVRGSLANSSENELTFGTQTEGSSDDEGYATCDESPNLSKSSQLDIPLVQKFFSNVHSNESFQNAFSELKKHAIAVYSSEENTDNYNQSDLLSVICKDSLVSKLLSVYDSVPKRKLSIFSPIFQSYLSSQPNENTSKTIFTPEQINDLLNLVECAKNGLQAYQAIQDYIKNEGLTIPLLDPLMSALTQQYVCLQQRQQSDLSYFVKLYALPAKFVAAHESSREALGKVWAESVLNDAFVNSVAKNDVLPFDEIDIDRMCEIVEITRDANQAIDAVDAYRKTVAFRPFSATEFNPEEAFSYRAEYFLERERDKTYPLLFAECVGDFLYQEKDHNFCDCTQYKKQGRQIAANNQLTPFKQCQQLIKWFFKVSRDDHLLHSEKMLMAWDRLMCQEGLSAIPNYPELHRFVSQKLVKKDLGWFSEVKNTDSVSSKKIMQSLKQIVAIGIEKGELSLNDYDALIRLVLAERKGYSNQEKSPSEWFKGLGGFELIDQLLVARARQMKFNSSDFTIRVAALEDFALFLALLREEYDFVSHDLSAAVVSRLRLEKNYVKNPSLKNLFDAHPIKAPAIYSPILRHFIEQCPKDIFTPEQIKAMLTFVEPVVKKQKMDTSLDRYRSLYNYVKNLSIEFKYKNLFRDRFVALQQSTFKEVRAAKFSADLLSPYQNQLHSVDVVRLTDEIAVVMEANDPKNPAERQQKVYSAIIQYIDALTSRLDLLAFEQERLSSLCQLRAYCVKNRFGNYLFFSQFIDRKYAEFQSKIPETAQYIDSDKLSKNCLLAKLEVFILSVQSCYESDKETGKKAIFNLIMRYLILVNPGKSHYYDLIDFLFYKHSIFHDGGKFNVELVSDLLCVRLIQLGKIEGLSVTQLSERQDELEVMRQLLNKRGSIYKSSGLLPVYESLYQRWSLVESSLMKATQENTNSNLSPKARIYAYPAKGIPQALLAGMKTHNHYIAFVYEMIQLKKENQLMDIDKSLLLILLEQGALISARSPDVYDYIGVRDSVLYSSFNFGNPHDQRYDLSDEFGESDLKRVSITFGLHLVQMVFKKGLKNDQNSEKWLEANFKSVLNKIFSINKICNKFGLLKQNSCDEFIDGNSFFKAMYQELDTARFWSDFVDKQKKTHPAAILLLQKEQNNSFGYTFILYALQQRLTTVKKFQEGKDLLELVLRLDTQQFGVNAYIRNKNKYFDQIKILDFCLEKCTHLGEYNRLVEMIFHRIPGGENSLDWSKLVEKIDTLDEYRSILAEISKGYLVYPYVNSYYTTAQNPRQINQVRLFFDKTINLMAKKFSDRHDSDQGELLRLFSQIEGRKDSSVDSQVDLSAVESLKAFHPTPHPALFKEIANQYQTALQDRKPFLGDFSDDDQIALRASKEIYADEKATTVNQSSLRQCCDLLTMAYCRLNKGDFSDMGAEQKLIAQVLLTFMASRPSDADYQGLLCFLCDRKIQYGDGNKLGYFTKSLIDDLLIVKMESFQKFFDTELFDSMIKHLSTKYGYDVAGSNVHYIMKLELKSSAFRYKPPTDDIDLLVKHSLGRGGITELDFVNFDLLRKAQFFTNDRQEEFNFYQKFITNILAHTQQPDELVMTKLFRVGLDWLKLLRSRCVNKKPSPRDIAFLDFLAEKSKKHVSLSKKLWLKITSELFLSMASHIPALDKFSISPNSTYFAYFSEIFTVYQDYVNRHQINNELSYFYKQLVNLAVDQCQMIKDSHKKGVIIKGIARNFAYYKLHKNEPFSLDFFNRLMGNFTAILPKCELANIDNFAVLAASLVYVYFSFLKIDKSFIEPPLSKVLKAWFSNLSTFEEYKKSIKSIKAHKFFSVKNQVRKHFFGVYDSTTLTSMLNKSSCIDLANFSFNSEKMAQAIKENSYSEYSVLLERLIGLLKDRKGHFFQDAIPFVTSQIAAFAKINPGLTLSILTKLKLDEGSKETVSSIKACVNQIIESEKTHYPPLLKALIQVSDGEGQIFRSFDSSDLSVFYLLTSAVENAFVNEPLIIFSHAFNSACESIAYAAYEAIVNERVNIFQKASCLQLRKNALLMGMVLQKPSAREFDNILKRISREDSLLNDLLILRAQSLETPAEFDEFSAFLKDRNLTIKMILPEDSVKKAFSELTQHDLGMISLQRAKFILDKHFSNAAQCQQLVTEIFKLKEHYQLPLEKMDRVILLRILVRAAESISSFNFPVDMGAMESIYKMGLEFKLFDMNIPNSSAYFDFMRVFFATSPANIPLFHQLVNQLPIDTSRITNSAVYVELIGFCLGMSKPLPNEIMEKLISRLPLLEFLKFDIVLQQNTKLYSETDIQNRSKHSQLFHSALRKTLMNGRFMEPLLKQLDTPVKRMQFVTQLQKITEEAPNIVKGQKIRTKFVKRCHELMQSQLVILMSNRMGEFESIAQKYVLKGAYVLIDGNNNQGNYAYLTGSSLLETFENWVAKQVDEYTREKQNLIQKVEKIDGNYDSIEVINLEKNIALVNEYKNSLETKFNHASKRCNDLADRLNERLAVQKQKNQENYLQQSKQLSDFEKRGVLSEALSKQKTQIEKADRLRKKYQSLYASDPDKFNQCQIDLKDALSALQDAFVEKDTFFKTVLSQLNQQHQKFDSAKTLVETQVILVSIDEALAVENQAADQLLGAIEKQLAVVEKFITDGEVCVQKIELQKSSNESRYQSVKTHYSEELTRGKTEVEALQALEKKIQEKKARLFNRVKFDSLPLTEAEKTFFLNSQKSVESALSHIDQSLTDQIWRFKESRNRWDQKSLEVDKCLKNPKALVKAQTEAVNLYVLEEKNVSVWMETFKAQRTDIEKRIEAAQKTLDTEKELVCGAFINRIETKCDEQKRLNQECQEAKIKVEKLESQVSNLQSDSWQKVQCLQFGLESVLNPLENRSLMVAQLLLKLGGERDRLHDLFNNDLSIIKITAAAMLPRIDRQQEELAAQLKDNERELGRTQSLLWVFDSFLIRHIPFIVTWIVEWNNFCDEQKRLEETRLFFTDFREKTHRVTEQPDDLLECAQAVISEIEPLGEFFVGIENRPELIADPTLLSNVKVLSFHLPELPNQHNFYHTAQENMVLGEQEQTRLDGLAAQLKIAREEHRLLSVEVQKIDVVIKDLTARYTEFNESIAEQRYLDTLAGYAKKPSPIVAVLRDKYGKGVPDIKGIPNVAERLLRDLVAYRADCVNLPEGAVTPLYLAVKHGSREDVQWLLEHRADSTREVRNQTPLKLAFRKNQPALVELFKSSVVTPNQKDSLNRLFIRLLANLPVNFDRVLLLLDHHDWIGLPNNAFASVLHKAIMCGNAIMVDRLLKLPNTVKFINEFVDGKAALHVAIEQKPIRLDIIAQLLKHKADVNQLSQGGTPLHIALKQSNISLDIVKVLLKVGADVSVLNAENKPPFAAVSNVTELKDAHGDNLLHWALKASHILVVKKLLSGPFASSKAVNMPNEEGDSPLHLAVALGDECIPIVKALLKKGADIRAVNVKNKKNLLQVATVVGAKQLQAKLQQHLELKLDKDNNTLLHLAVISGRIASLKLALDQNKKENWFSIIDDKNKKGDTALDMAVEHGNLDMAKLLLENGANVKLPRNAKNSVGNTLLHLAFFQGDIELLKWLIRHGANINEKDKQGNTLLHLAVSQNDIEWVKWLLEQGADVNKRDKQGDTPLHLAIAQANPDMVRKLLAKKPKFVKNQAGETPLLSAINARDPAVLVELKNHIGEWWDISNSKSELFNQPGADKDAALHKAIRQGDLAFVKWLLDNGADINQVDAQGNAPLHLVLQEKQEKLRGAHNHLVNSYCISAVYDGMVRLLLANKLKLSLQDREGNTALLLAIKQNDSTAESQFIQHMGNWFSGKAEFINLADKQGNTVLHLAVNHWKVELVDWLVDNGADVNAVNTAQETPFSSDKGYNLIFNLTTADVKYPLVKKLEEKGITLSSTRISSNFEATPVIPSNSHYNPFDTLVKQVPAIPSNPNYNPFNTSVDQPPQSNMAVKPAGVAASIRKIDPSELIVLYDGKPPKWRTIQAMIVEEGYPLDVSKEDGNTLLHLAAEKGDMLMIQFLLRQATRRQFATVSTVDQWVALLEKPNAEGNTALHMAVKIGKHEVTQLLLQTMVGNYSAPNNENKTCLDIAFEQRDPKLFGLILAKVTNWRAFIQAKMKLDDEEMQHFWIAVAQHENLPVIRRKMLLRQECTVKNTSHKFLRTVKNESNTRTTTLAAICFEAAMSKEKTADGRALILNLMERSGYDKGVMNTFTERMDFANKEVRQVGIALIQSVPEAQHPVLINAIDCHGNTLLHSAIEGLDIEKKDENRPGSVQWCLGYGAIPKPALPGKAILPFFNEVCILETSLKNKEMKPQLKYEKIEKFLTQYAPKLSEADRKSTIELCHQFLNIPGGYLGIIGLCFEKSSFDLTPKNRENISVLALARKKSEDTLNSIISNMIGSSLSGLLIYVKLIEQIVGDFAVICESELHLPKRKLYAGEPGDTELHKFISMGMLEQNWDSTLFDLPSHIHTPNNLGRTPLHLAVFLGDVNAVKFLLEKGALVNACCTDTAEQMGETPLHRLASRIKTADFSKERFLELTQLLLEKGAENVLDKQGFSILHKLAARKDDVGLAMFSVILNYLLKDIPVGFQHARLGTDLDSGKAQCERTPGFTWVNEDASENCNAASIQNRQFPKRYNLDALGGEHKMTVLHYLAKNRHDAQGLEMFKQMLAAGANVNVQDAQGWTVLHHLTQADDTVAMQMLDFILQTKRVDLQLESYAEGYTPAMAAFIGGNEEFLKRVPLGITDDFRFLRNDVKETVRTIQQKVSGTPESTRSNTPEGRGDAVHPSVFTPPSSLQQRVVGEREQPIGSPKHRKT